MSPEDSSITKSTVDQSPGTSEADDSSPESLPGINVCVIGGGFVGLVTAAGFAEFGHQVVCVENNPERLATLSKGSIPFYERDLEELIKRNLKRKRLTFSSDLLEAAKGQRAIFITVGTPSSAGGRTDLSALTKVATDLGKVAQAGQVVVIKSTAPVGTAAYLRKTLAASHNGSGSIAVVSNPEFLREGSAVYDFLHPERIVIGGDSPGAVELITHIHRLGMNQQTPIVVTDNETAEMIKYASNVYLATKIGFANELAGLCDAVNVNVMEVARGMGLDPRIGPDFLNPGPGWGGSCLPKDISEYIGMAEARGVEALIARAVREANGLQRKRILEKVRTLTGELKGKRIGVLGLSFKAGTSDLRESPAVDIVRMLIDEGSQVLAYDPAAMIEAAAQIPQLQLAKTPEDVAVESDCLLILTEWEDFQLLDWNSMGERMTSRNMVDTRNLLTPESMQRHGFTYLSVGQK